MDQNVIFSHIILEGAPYTIGKAQGEALKAIPPWAAFMRSGGGRFSPGSFKVVFDLFDKFCPGLNEEVAGLADALQVPVEDIIYYANTFLKTGHCSHLAALPAVTADGHVLVGRSYEFGDRANDFRLITTRVNGRYAHIGTSSMLLGRLEGMNECGLSVTVSAGAIPPVGLESGLRPPIQDGFQFWMLVRVILEQCRTLAEALEMVEMFPLCGNSILIIAEKNGQAALVEFFGPHQAVKLIGQDSEEKMVFAANHFQLPEMQRFENNIMPHSVARFNAIATLLMQASPHISLETIRTLLSTPYPAGTCCHFYKEFFGTLHSAIFDLTSGEVEYCLGSPQTNPWRRFNLMDGTVGSSYPVSLPQEMAPANFWK